MSGQTSDKGLIQLLILSILAFLLFVFVGQASALEVTVQSVIPNYETVQVPHQECHDVAVPVAPGYGDQGINAGTVIGGVAGGVVGSTIGRGSGRTLATVAGALLGATVGHEVTRQPEPPQYVTQTRCQTIWTAESRVRNYTVVFQLPGGETFTQIMHFAPQVGARFHANVYVGDGQG